MINPDFVVRVSENKNNKSILLAMLNDIDTEKREVKRKLQNYSNGVASKNTNTRKTRERTIRSLVAKRGYLNDERDLVFRAIQFENMENGL